MHFTPILASLALTVAPLVASWDLQAFSDKSCSGNVAWSASQPGAAKCSNINADNVQCLQGSFDSGKFAITGYEKQDCQGAKTDLQSGKPSSGAFMSFQVVAN